MRQASLLLVSAGRLEGSEVDRVKTAAFAKNKKRNGLIAESAGMSARRVAPFRGKVTARVVGYRVVGYGLLTQIHGVRDRSTEFARYAAALRSATHAARLAWLSDLFGWVQHESAWEARLRRTEVATPAEL